MLFKTQIMHHGKMEMGLYFMLTHSFPLHFNALKILIGKILAWKKLLKPGEA